MIRFFRRRRDDPKTLLKDALGDYDLPNIPVTALHALRLLRDPNSSTKAVARAVEQNPAVVLKLLKTVNSAAFGLRSQVSSTDRAVALLGRSQLESLVVGFAVSGRLPRPTGGGFDSHRFWQSAARRATLARALATTLHPQTAAECFVVGLLQDMAVPFLSQTRPHRYSDILGHWRDTPEACLAALEESEFGWSHEELGAAMAHQWGLPIRLARGIDDHHEAPETGADDTDGGYASVRLVAHLREQVSDRCLEQLVESCRSHYNLTPDTVVERFDSANRAATALGMLLA